MKRMPAIRRLSLTQTQTVRRRCVSGLSTPHAVNVTVSVSVLIVDSKGEDNKFNPVVEWYSF